MLRPFSFLRIARVCYKPWVHGARLRCFRHVLFGTLRDEYRTFPLPLTESQDLDFAPISTVLLCS